jgi:DnaJ-class molecular chaperone
MEEHANLRQATHYQILGISSSILDSHHDASSVLKQAYRRALLQNHPDKAASGTTRSSIYTVDQITTAFNILSSPKDRAAYDTALRLARAGGESETQTRFQTGVENVDLDDLPYDEAANCWYRSCRCGNERAYQFREVDLDEYGNDGELMVGCQDCSLWLRVHFAMVEDSGEDEA